METSLNDCIKEYKAQLEIGTIQKAYKGLMKYIMELRAHLLNKYSDNFVLGNVYHGYI